MPASFLFTLPDENDSLTLRRLNSGLLLGVSGGADSVALLHYYAGRAGSLGATVPVVGHVNHGLRGEESDADAAFVRSLAEEYGLKFVEHRISPEQWALDRTGSRESAARNIRYDFFIRTAHRLELRYVATAHTANDQVETVLHRLFRGTGPAGLAGIASVRQLDPAVTLIRPLLNLDRETILQALIDAGRTWRNDSTNEENDFTRNRIRNILLPLIRQEINPKVDQALIRLANLAGETELLLNEWFEEMAEQVLISRSDHELVFHLTRLQAKGDIAVREFLVRIWKQVGWPLREMGAAQWDRLVEFVYQGRGLHPVRGRIVASHETGPDHTPRFILRQVEADWESSR